MNKSFDGQIVEIISLLRNYNKTINQLDTTISTTLNNTLESLDTSITNLDTNIESLDTNLENLEGTIASLEGTINSTLNIELDVTPEGFVISEDSKIIITCNIDKVCDTIVLKIDDEIIETYEDINSFVGEVTLNPEQVDSHKITIEATKGENTFIKNKVILPLS